MCEKTTKEMSVASGQMIDQNWAELKDTLKALGYSNIIPFKNQLLKEITDSDMETDTKRITCSYLQIAFHRMSLEIMNEEGGFI